MGVAITVRNVPDDVRDALAARAAQTGRSLQEYLSDELRHLAFAPSAAEAVVRARQHARSYPAVAMADIVEAVHAARK